MRDTFDTITDWIGISLLVVTVLLLVRLDLDGMSDERDSRPFRRSYRLAAVSGVVVLAGLTIARFAVLARS